MIRFWSGRSDSDQVEVPAREKVVAAWGPGQVVYIIQMRPGLNILQMIHASEETKNSDFIPDHLVDGPVLSIVLCPIVKESPSTPFPLFHLEPTSSKLWVFPQVHLPDDDNALIVPACKELAIRRPPDDIHSTLVPETQTECCDVFQAIHIPAHFNF